MTAAAIIINIVIVESKLSVTITASTASSDDDTMPEIEIEASIINNIMSCTMQT